LLKLTPPETSEFLGRWGPGASQRAASCCEADRRRKPGTSSQTTFAPKWALTSVFPISGAGSDGRRNTCSESTRGSLFLFGCKARESYAEHTLAPTKPRPVKEILTVGKIDAGLESWRRPLLPTISAPQSAGKRKVLRLRRLDCRLAHPAFAGCAEPRSNQIDGIVLPAIRLSPGKA